MLNSTKMMRAAERAMKRTVIYRTVRDKNGDPENNFKLSYVMIKGSKETPDAAIGYAHYQYEAILFDPFKNGADFTRNFEFSFDYDLFSYLEEGYALVGMSTDCHAMVWAEIQKGYEEPALPDGSKPENLLHNPGIRFQEGMRKYFDFCKKNKITVDLLRRKCGYTGKDVMALYRR